ncbi:MAG: hypothetical protein NZ822_02350, partial [Patescibacteria group bacterium]|nr:hypothetical protein [Patescibacteria group bacterium]
QVSSTDVGTFGYDVVKLNDRVSYLFKGYVLYKLPSDSREPASYVRDPSLDIFVTPEQFSFNPYDNRYYPYYGDYKIGKRAPCDSGDIIRYDCPASFRTTSTEEVLYDVQFSNPFKNNPSLRMGNIAIFTTAFSNLNPALSFAKLFAQSPTFDSENSQVVTNEVFRQLLISSLYSREYFELIIDHNLWIQPSKEVGSVVFWGSSSDGRGGHNCPAGANNFPCKNEINIYGFPLAGIDGGSGYFFRNLLKNYFKGNANINLIVKISGRSGDGQVNLCFDNNLKKVYYDLLIIRDVGGGGYDVFSDGRIRLGVDTNGGPGDVKIYIYRVPFINRTCANLGYQELMNYSW